MKMTLTPLQSRALAIAILITVTAIIVLMVYLPIQRAHDHYDSAIEDMLERVARYERIAAQRPAVEANIAQIKKADSRRHYLKSSAPALASAEIQQIAQTIMEANGLTLESTQIGVHRDEGMRRRVTVSFQLRGPLSSVQQTLYQIETTTPYLFVDRLLLRSAVGRDFRPVPGAEPDVLVQFDLYAFALVPQPAMVGR